MWLDETKQGRGHHKADLGGSCGIAALGTVGPGCCRALCTHRLSPRAARCTCQHGHASALLPAREYVGPAASAMASAAVHWCRRWLCTLLTESRCSFAFWGCGIGQAGSIGGRRSIRLHESRSAQVTGNTWDKGWPVFCLLNRRTLKPQPSGQQSASSEPRSDWSSSCMLCAAVQLK